MVRDALFAAGVLALSALVLSTLLVGEPFGEAHAAQGAWWGWGLAVLAIAPSYVLLSRTVHDEDAHRFHRAFMLGTMGRFIVCMAGALVFHFRFEQAPMKIFLLAFGLGWLLLTGLELGLVLAPRRAPLNREEHA